jgi:phosphoadenosine phosphosulfate reductase
MSAAMTPERTQPDVTELAELSARFEAMSPLEAAVGSIDWTLEHCGDDVVVASSFQDLVLVDLVEKAHPGLEIIFLDTEFHFKETLAFVEHTAKVRGLNLTITHPQVGPDEFVCGTPDCCQKRKVEPLAKAISGKKAWITGLKRVDTPERTGAPIVAFDEARQMLKVNPLATWSDEDIFEYLEEHSLPLHPLQYVGYVSIGCAPTTKPVPEGHDPREGRWPGSDKTECGLHI